jgi:putative acetyltransferase
VRRVVATAFAHPDAQGQARDDVLAGSAVPVEVSLLDRLLDEPLVALLGDPTYYRRYGFRAATGYGITPPNPQWGDYFQVRTLYAYRGKTGAFSYAGPFNQLP